MKFPHVHNPQRIFANPPGFRAREARMGHISGLEFFLLTGCEWDSEQ